MADRSETGELSTAMHDVFGVPTRNVPTNVLDIPSHYPVSAERLRVFVDGVRQFPEYGSVSQYNHATEVHELMPAQGETVRLETAERPRYAVGFEQVYSWAFGMDRELESGDWVRVGAYDDDEGWYMQHEGGHGPTEVDLYERRGGTDTRKAQNRTVAGGVDAFSRLSLHTAWYRVTRQRFRNSLARGGDQFTEEVGDMSGAGPRYGNLPLRYEVHRDSASTALTMEAGSVALLTKGDRTEIRRQKRHLVELTTDGAADGSTWFPRYAMRVDPARSIVNVQMSRMEVLKYGGADDVEVLMEAHAAEKVADSNGDPLTDGNFDMPIEHSAQGSVMQESYDVAQAADSDGTVTTSTADTYADNPGGYQIGEATLVSSGSGSKTNVRDSALQRKRAVYGGDISVIWVKADNSGVELMIDIATEQDW